MAAAAWASAFLYSLLHTANTFSLPLCPGNALGQFFCEIPQILKLSCSKSYLRELGLLAVSACLAFGCFVFIVFSYVQIFRAVLRIPSEQGRHKAFYTCLPHLAVVSLFLSTVMFAYLKPPSISSSSLDLALSVLYSVVPPALNPLIYSLRNQELKAAVWRLMTGCYPRNGSRDTEQFWGLVHGIWPRLKRDRRRDGRLLFGPPGQLAKREQPGTANEEERRRVSIPVAEQFWGLVHGIWPRLKRDRRRDGRLPFGPPGQVAKREQPGTANEEERRRIEGHISQHKFYNSSKDYLEGEEVTRKYLKTIGQTLENLRKKGYLPQTSPLDANVHNINPGDWVLIKTWTNIPLTPKFEGPYQVLLTTHTAVRTEEKGWTHITRVKGPVPPPGENPSSAPSPDETEWTVTPHPKDLKLTF
ncbi:hypothetical protein DUI87_34750 [Hirundo rustica rustica]|uniref:G-protein coupled receptors family 1 profile domain-containing protein n=1 Tax=Hirundo rustica rustica TaxID=333673 RepID=A0A3M0J2S3_HIRRU|nr:hypothetical protein DUI87_34750 [Hirundo rustica rustica]